ncbi:prephenate dehydratase [Prochlorococcus sp. MIT 1300]|uniref:prephenate dehydratase n=1 Tax=Prochlorococcus sp. MIT 1300 TaxID=3096218 RepID=UPI002A760A11|nr:prephenate dehydratase [Prochlorococcus sp. MIT 1300]
MLKRLAFLGPEGTYAEKAAISLAELEGLQEIELVPCQGLHSVVEHVAKKNCDGAVIPIENSVEGGVTASLDALWLYPELFIQRALVIPIQHSLIGSGQIQEISEVLSHPQALAQCSGWLSKHLPNALQLPTTSTADAVRMIKGSKFRAAIASKNSGNPMGLLELAFPINDLPGNRTRFLLLSHDEPSRKADIASIAFSLHANSPGALLKALKCIAKLGLNMSRIESRPSKRELGEYVFFVDVELPNQIDHLLVELLQSLDPLCEHLANFGAYPSDQMI